jgi:hypothetical protein
MWLRLLRERGQRAEENSAWQSYARYSPCKVTNLLRTRAAEHFRSLRATRATTFDARTATAQN